MKRILEEIELSKIACVDRPAQEGAVVTILKRAPKQQQVDDPDDDGSVDDWSPKDQSRRRKKIKGWDREAIDQVNKRGGKVEHPFMRRARALSQKHGVPLYLGMSAARREDPKSFHHFNATSSRPRQIQKAMPDDATLAWDSAVNTWATNYGVDRCTAMSEIRKRAPALWARFRRSR